MYTKLIALETYFTDRWTFYIGIFSQMEVNLSFTYPNMTAVLQAAVTRH